MEAFHTFLPLFVMFECMASIGFQSFWLWIEFFPSMKLQSGDVVQEMLSDVQSGDKRICEISVLGGLSL